MGPRNGPQRAWQKDHQRNKERWPSLEIRVQARACRLWNQEDCDRSSGRR